MDNVISLSGRSCRYFKHGRCANFFWQIMKSEGKSGLKKYDCLHWRNKLDNIERHWEAVCRMDSFGLKGEEREKAIDRFLSRNDHKQIICPDYRPDPAISTGQCRYYYLQICLLKFPECECPCENYLPDSKDQRT
ncbi:MAG: hypothetical protein JRG97_01155 [Deltaproteobacteria bacterium]|nr:hypothetical protein [Deltaproteobacteria bacterium]MBW2051794.1 hypothetical protein [Deltaproteobacteria bacterium]MBW2139662.1 hypothetical protein [Deltaproteobacteria bacterium]MBW2322159.1 hypothetical protein [Deltaproteobacteria bacterium]